MNIANPTYVVLSSIVLFGIAKLLFAGSLVLFGARTKHARFKLQVLAYQHPIAMTVCAASPTAIMLAYLVGTGALSASSSPSLFVPIAIGTLTTAVAVARIWTIVSAVELSAVYVKPQSALRRF